MRLDRSVVDRLVLARHLYGAAKLGLESGSVAGLHTCANVLQDAVEVFLVALADVVGASIGTRTEFDKYFVEVEKKLSGDSLPHKVKLNRLNHVRVASKHQGIKPQIDELESILPAVTDFFDQVCQERMECNFWTVTAADLLRDGESKALLLAAIAAFDRGDLREALIGCRRAIYVEIEQDYDISQFRHDAPSETGLLALFGRYSNAPLWAQSADYIDRYVKDASDLIVHDTSHLAQRLLGNGVDPTMFWNVMRLTPKMWRTRDTKEWRTQTSSSKLTDSNVSRNCRYVVSSTTDILLAIHSQSNAQLTPGHEGLSGYPIRSGVRVYEKADRASTVVGVLDEEHELDIQYDIESIDGQTMFWRIVAVSAGYLSGYVIRDEIRLENEE